MAFSTSHLYKNLLTIYLVIPFRIIEYIVFLKISFVLIAYLLPEGKILCIVHYQNYAHEGFSVWFVDFDPHVWSLLVFLLLINIISCDFELSVLLAEVRWTKFSCSQEILTEGKTLLRSLFEKILRSPLCSCCRGYRRLLTVRVRCGCSGAWSVLGHGVSCSVCAVTESLSGSAHQQVESVTLW